MIYIANKKIRYSTVKNADGTFAPANETIQIGQKLKRDELELLLDQFDITEKELMLHFRVKDNELENIPGAILPNKKTKDKSADKKSWLGTKAQNK